MKKFPAWITTGVLPNEYFQSLPLCSPRNVVNIRLFHWWSSYFFAGIESEIRARCNNWRNSSRVFWPMLHPPSVFALAGLLTSLSFIQTKKKKKKKTKNKKKEWQRSSFCTSVLFSHHFSTLTAPGICHLVLYK